MITALSHRSVVGAAEVLAVFATQKYLEIDQALAELEQSLCVIVPAVPREIPRQMLER
jgi:hypothetical protein